MSVHDAVQEISGSRRGFDDVAGRLPLFRYTVEGEVANFRLVRYMGQFTAISNEAAFFTLRLADVESLAEIRLLGMAARDLERMARELGAELDARGRELETTERKKP